MPPKAGDKRKRGAMEQETNAGKITAFFASTPKVRNCRPARPTAAAAKPRDEIKFQKFLYCGELHDAWNFARNRPANAPPLDCSRRYHKDLVSCFYDWAGGHGYRAYEVFEIIRQGGGITLDHAFETNSDASHSAIPLEGSKELAPSKPNGLGKDSAFTLAACAREDYMTSLLFDIPELLPGWGRIVDGGKTPLISCIGLMPHQDPASRQQHQNAALRILAVTDDDALNSQFHRRCAFTFAIENEFLQLALAIVQRPGFVPPSWETDQLPKAMCHFSGPKREQLATILLEQSYPAMIGPTIFDSLQQNEGNDGNQPKAYMPIVLCILIADFTCNRRQLLDFYQMSMYALADF